MGSKSFITFEIEYHLLIYLDKVNCEFWGKHTGQIGDNQLPQQVLEQ